LFASDIETCKHVSASFGFFVIPVSERESPSRIKEEMPDQVGHDTFDLVILSNAKTTSKGESRSHTRMDMTEPKRLGLAPIQ